MTKQESKEKISKSETANYAQNPQVPRFIREGAVRIRAGWTGLGICVGFLSTFSHQEVSGTGERHKTQKSVKTSDEVKCLNFSLASVRLTF